MLDFYRELEQRGIRCRQEEGRIRCDHPSGGVEYWYTDGHYEYHGPRMLCVKITGDSMTAAEHVSLLRLFWDWIQSLFPHDRGP